MGISMTEKLDRHTDPSGLVASLGESGGPQFLGDSAVVERLVRQFVADVVTRFDEVGHGVLTPEDAANADRDACFRMAQVFSGLDPAYTSMRGWTGHGLASHLRNSMTAELAESDDDAEVIAQAFAVLVHAVYDALRVSATASEASVMQTVERAVQSLSRSLVGVVGND